MNIADSIQRPSRPFQADVSLLLIEGQSISFTDLEMSIYGESEISTRPMDFSNLKSIITVDLDKVSHQEPSTISSPPNIGNIITIDGKNSGLGTSAD